MRTLVLLVAVAVAAAYHEECGENAHFESCGTACPLTCDNYDNPPKFCVLRCDIGCQCDAGYVKAADGKCVRPEDCPPRAPKPTKQTCKEAPEAGRCLAYVPQWYYDPTTLTCNKFIYGGCGGNGNRYETEEECMQNCFGIMHQSSETDTCDLPAKRGFCFGRFPRYYFEKTTGLCNMFIYGGCGGNANNFKTIEECEKACVSAAPSACQQEKAVGLCQAYFERYFFNKETGSCEKFIYGGCGGNSNNFHSQEECEAVCVA